MTFDCKVLRKSNNARLLQCQRWENDSESYAVSQPNLVEKNFFKKLDCSLFMSKAMVEGKQIMTPPVRSIFKATEQLKGK